MSKLTLSCKGYTPINKNTLVGKADIHIAELRLTIRGVLLFESHDKRWASLPAPPMLDKAGVALRDDKGKVRYANNALEFDTKDIRDAFSAQVIARVLEFAPAAFEPEEE
jgi:hypothetical protein